MVNQGDMPNTQFKQDVVGVYNRAAPSYDHVGVQFFAYFGKLLVDQLGIDPNTRVLDVATGCGAMLFPAAEKVGKLGIVIGIDLAPAMLEHLQADINQRGLTNVTLALMDGDHLGFTTEAFDYVLCGSALFLLNYEQALKDIYRLLIPGGCFATWVSTNSQDQRHIERWKWMYDLTVSLFPPDFTPPLSWQASTRLNKPDLLQMALETVGFTEVSVSREEVDMTFADEQDWWAWEWSQAPRFTLEALTPESLEVFKTSAFAELQTLKQSDGIHYMFSALFATGHKLLSPHQS